MANSSSIVVSPGASISGRRGLELGGLAGEFFAGVVLGEGNLQVPGLARPDADQLLFEARNELAGADHDLDALAGAAVERHAVDGALEVDGDAVAVLGLGALALGVIGPALVGDALDGFVDIGIGDFDHRLLDREALEVGELDRRHDLDRNRVGQVGLAGEQFLDLGCLGRHGDLRLGREAKAAIGEDLGVGVADGLVDGLGHHRAAIDLLQMADRHLAGTEAVETDLVLEVDQLDRRLGIEVGGGNADLELVLQSLGEGFGDLHGVNLLPLAPGPKWPRQCPINRRAASACAGGSADPYPQRGHWPSSILQANAESAWCGRRDSNPHNFRHWNLNPARLPVPPRPLADSIISGREAASMMPKSVKRFSGGHHAPS